MIPRQRATTRTRASGRGRSKQLELPRTRGWGGARRRAGRKRRAGRRSVAHRARPEHRARLPLHVTVRLVDEVGQLRTRRRYRALLVAMCEGKKRFGFRLCHYTVQGNHLHLVVEADSALALSRGMKGLGVRIARGLNKELGRKGRVVADRYHARALGTPAEVKNALAYVYGNARVHARRRGGRGPMGVDGYTSWGTTRGVFADIPEVSGPSGWEVMVDFADPPVVPPRSWLLRTGWWLRHGHL